MCQLRLKDYDVAEELLKSGTVVDEAATHYLLFVIKSIRSDEQEGVSVPSTERAACVDRSTAIRALQRMTSAPDLRSEMLVWAVKVSLWPSKVSSVAERQLTASFGVRPQRSPRFRYRSSPRHGRQSRHAGQRRCARPCSLCRSTRARSTSRVRSDGGVSAAVCVAAWSRLLTRSQLD